ncbi:MAG: hypothetical protein PHI27_12155 [Eubacteriales bacterium]|nr:hypothetical protein [Eubacteriales bacterium]MDD3882977.1 hypothetical protein [Eubacteriales bacterium]MDD4513476.1 hypothetical protein [Eubacteriales bacterium]
MATALEWIDGNALDKDSLTPEIAFMMGETVARLHPLLKPLDGVYRYRYDSALLERMTREIRSAEKNGDIDELAAKMCRFATQSRITPLAFCFS